MERRKKISKTVKKTFAIVVDGETEVWYFQMLKRNEPDLQVNIEPKIPQKKKLSERYEKVLELSEYFTKVFWIIDLDVIIRESKKTKKGQSPKIQNLKRHLKELEKDKFSNIIPILVNPCLGYWFLLHFEKTTKYFSNCREAEKQLKRHLKDYKKTQKYFTKQDNDIYLRLKSRLLTAISNSKNLKRGNLDNEEHGICEMNLFFESKEINILKRHQ